MLRSKSLSISPSDPAPRLPLHPVTNPEQKNLARLRSLFERLEHSELFQRYRQAYLKATGLPLQLEFAADPDSQICRSGENENRFCQAINDDHSNCEACIETTEKLRNNLDGEIYNLQCFAGMQETAVPVRSGETLIAYLKTGEIFVRKPTKRQFKPVAETLETEGYPKEKIDELRAAWLTTPVIDEQRYTAITTMLITFGAQLSRSLDDLILQTEEHDPPAVARAKEFIQKHLQESIPLPLVARHAGLSEHHFSRVFKQVAGIPFTEYVNRARVELAKEMLLRPHARVTEVAYEIGFQSLSQFNRSFARFTGQSPTQFRRDAQENLDSSASSAQSAG
jgi:AraC-like DNA-binding protein/ligand-binding sensor protein